MAKSPEGKARQAEAMRRYWASLSNETRIRIGGRISQSLTGKVQSEAHLRANSEGHRGKVLSEGTRRKLSDSLILAYAEGRKQPVRSSHRRGARHTEEAKAKIREARARQVMWNKGVKTGPMPREVVEKRAASQRGKPHAITQAVLAGRVRMIEKKRGRKATEETKRKQSESQRKTYQQGRTVPFSSGYGKGAYYASPCQGQIWLRSSSEIQRAQELDAAKEVWLYEIEAYPLMMDGKRTTYRPDFWILPQVARGVSLQDPVAFLHRLPKTDVLLEDVKGWWSPSHKTYPKIMAFQAQYPELNFQIVVRKGIRKHGQ